jgi:hypothetical protein
MDKIFLADSRLCAWVEQESSVHIKAVTKEGDPVELSDEEVRELENFLRRYLASLQQQKSL